MSGSNVEHVSCYLDGSPRHFSRPSSRSSSHCFKDPPDGALYGAPTPPPDTFPSTTTTYSRPNLADSLQDPLPTSTSMTTRPDDLDQIQPSLPNPDDYYRHHQSPLADGSGVNLSDTSVTGPRIGTNEHPVTVDRAFPLPTESLESSPVRRPQYRSISYSSYKGLSNGPSKTPQVASSVPGSRQASFKDLVNKFNNNSDQILPLPSSKSGETSRAASPAGSFDGQSRSRPSSRLREARDVSVQRSFTAQRDSSSSVVPDFSGHFTPPLRTTDSYGKHSDDLKPSGPSRRHPFSGKLALDTGFDNAQLGIPAHLRRRGSDGSIPSPSPASLDQELLSGISPLTPTAWYLRHTDHLEAVNSNGNKRSHRRATSDLAGDQSIIGFDVPNPFMAIPGPLQSGGLLETPHSKSRIPISSRHPVPNSISHVSSRLLGPNSTFSSRSATQGHLPAKGVSRLPVPSPKSSPGSVDDDAQEPFATSALGRREITNCRLRQPPESSSHLKAYIAAPPPKKSPPLRSSRPRQPVTNAASFPSRSRVGETVSNFQKQINRDRELRNARQRERRLPELGTVDLATRRQRIQQAFNRTVQENERKEEAASTELHRYEDDQAEEPRGTQQASEQPPAEHPIFEDLSQVEDTATVIDESTQAYDEEKEPMAEKEDSQGSLRLHIDTSIPTHESSETNADNHLVAMDSPTLGLPSTTSKEHDIVRLGSNASDRSPSAATAGSTATRTTTFDHELQTGLTRRTLNMSHRTLLNQIMQIRESSSSGSSCDEPDYSFSDNDDGESIPIMLRDPSYFGGSRGNEAHRENRDASTEEHGAAGETQNRWSMSS